MIVNEINNLFHPAIAPQGLKGLFRFEPDDPANPTGGGEPIGTPPADPPAPPPQEGGELKAQLDEKESRIKELEAELQSLKEGAGASDSEKDQEIANLRKQLEEKGIGGNEELKAAQEVVSALKGDLFETLSEEEKKVVEDIAEVAGGGDVGAIRTYMALKKNGKVGGTRPTPPPVNNQRTGGQPPGKGIPTSVESARAKFSSSLKGNL